MADKPFFPEIRNFMRSTPVIALALEGPNAIETIRGLLGPTDSAQAPKGTIRGDLGRNVMANVVHASDSPAAAQTELKRFFQPGEIFEF